MTMTLEMQRTRTVGRRPPLSTAERWGAGAVAVALVGFGTHGFRTGEPSTLGYLTVVLAVGAALATVRRHALPDWLAAGLPVLAIGHLCGGLVRIGNEVLYNTDPGWEVLQYDHIFHATASAVGVAVLWTLASAHINGRWLALALCSAGALGFGAANELVEFLATLAHRGSHVGGYLNTGWDLVANTVGVAVGAALLAARTRR